MPTKTKSADTTELELEKTQGELVAGESSEKPVAAPPSGDVTPVDMLRMAVEKNADLDYLKELYEMKRTWEADNARAAYHRAITAFRSNPPKITKDLYNNQYDSWYASLGGMVESVSPVMAEHDLSFWWEPEQMDDGTIRVTCVVAHEAGHTQRTTLQAKPDSTGSKNAIQQVKSTATYLRSVTLEMALGLAATMASREGDDDGNGAAPKPETVDDGTLKTIIDYAAETDTREQQFLRYLLKADYREGMSFDEIPAHKGEQAIRFLKAKAEHQRKKEGGE